MIRFKSITQRLTLMVTLASGVGLLIACTAFVVNDTQRIRHSKTTQLSALADVTGANCSAAIAFNEEQAAAELLASLMARPTIEYACIFRPDGTLFAEVHRDVSKGSPHPPIDANVESLFTPDGFLDISRPIIDDEDKLGVISIRASMDDLQTQFVSYLVIAGAVILMSLVVAIVLGYLLQNTISQPILNLATTAQKISDEDDYSIRVYTHAEDELGILYRQFNTMLGNIESSKKALEQAHEELEIRVKDRTRQLSDANVELSKENSERIRAEQELEDVHREFVESARRAGMAEIAIGVLHNVGNVLNSVNVSANMLSNQLQTSKVHQLAQVVDLLDQQEGDLGEFLATDEKGKQVPKFLQMLSEHLLEEREKLSEEAQAMILNVEHIGTIVSTQQSYAKSGGMVEPINVNTLFEDAVRLNATSFDRHGINVERDYGDLPSVLIDKQRVLQIVINLVKNAKEALTERKLGTRTLRLHTRTENDRLIMEVSDTGIGIDKENLTQIFSHGFTTKVSGHGFGLHSCANTATEMEGSLTAHSEGNLQGATFMLNLPLQLASVST